MAYNNRGNAKNFLKDYEDAISDFDKALEIQSSHNTYFNRGLAKESINDLNGAIKDYSDALEMKPNDIQSMLKRGYAKYRNNDLDGAIADYTCVLDADENNIDALVSMGIVQHKQQNDTEAVVCFTKAILADNNCTDAYINRSIAASALYNYKTAENDLLKMFTLDIHRNDYLSTYNEIRDILSTRDDEKSKEFAQKLEEMALQIKPPREQ